MDEEFWIEEKTLGMVADEIVELRMTRDELIAKMIALFAEIDELKGQQITSGTINKALEAENSQLRAALDGLLDGLDANYDERQGLSTEQFNERIKEAREALATKEE